MKYRVLCCILAVLLLCSCGAEEAARWQPEQEAEETLTWQEQYDLGLRFLSQGNYEEAVLAFSAAIEIDSRRPAAYAGRAEAYTGLGDYEAAAADYETAVESGDAPEEWFIQLYEVYIVLGWEEKAEEILSQTENNPPEREALEQFLLSRTLIPCSTKERALTVKQNTLEAEPFAISDGVLACALQDFDGDGTEELFTAEIEAGALRFCTYGYRNGQVGLLSQENLWEFNLSIWGTEIWHDVLLRTHKGVTYAVCLTGYWGGNIGIGEGEGASIAACRIENGCLYPEADHDYASHGGGDKDQQLRDFNAVLDGLGLAQVYQIDAVGTPMDIYITDRSEVTLLARVFQRFTEDAARFRAIYHGEAVGTIAPLLVTVTTAFGEAAPPADQRGEDDPYDALAGQLRWLEPVTDTRDFTEHPEWGVGVSAYSLPNGSLAAELGDFDGNGTRELVEVRLEYGDVSLCLYETRDGTAVQTDRRTVYTGPFGDFPHWTQWVKVFLQQHEGTGYVFVEHYLVGGLLADGVSLHLQGFAIEEGGLVPVLDQSVAGSYFMPGELDDTNAKLAAFGLPAVQDDDQTDLSVAARSDGRILASLEQFYTGSSGDFFANQDAPEKIPPMRINIYAGDPREQ